jgi:hypothetical protein
MRVINTFATRWTSYTSALPTHYQQHIRTFLNDATRNTAIQTFFQHIELNYGNLSSLIDKGPASETIVSSDGVIHPQHLVRLCQHEATALHIPNFFHPEGAKQLGEELIQESLMRTNSGKSSNWKVSTSRGLESSDVATLGEHPPYNVAVARDREYRRVQSEDETRSSPINEYFEGVQREFQFRRKRKHQLTKDTNQNKADHYRLWPLDKLRLELEEAWPCGCGLARETSSSNDNSQLQYPRPFGGGLPRLMMGPTRWKRGFIHVDEMGPLDVNRGLFSANIYLTVPENKSGDGDSGDATNNAVPERRKGRKDAGALYIWPLGVRSRWDWYRVSQMRCWLRVAYHFEMLIEVYLFT